VDNGTVGKYGAEIALRRKLEKFISIQSLNGSKGNFFVRDFFFFEKKYEIFFWTILQKIILLWLTAICNVERTSSLDH
jgi:hypothetical protein